MLGDFIEVGDTTAVESSEDVTNTQEIGIKNHCCGCCATMIADVRPHCGAKFT
jgi:hypothetical protein